MFDDGDWVEQDEPSARYKLWARGLKAAVKPGAGLRVAVIEIGCGIRVRAPTFSSSLVLRLLTESL
jgi:hypothetical protein